MKILLTGGSGFIGSHVADNLKKRGCKVTIFDHHAIGENTPDVFLGDVRDATAVQEAVAVHDGVMHLAGVLGTQETIENPLPSVETNILGGLNIFQAVKRYKKRAVYIGVGNHWMRNSYSITKTTAENFALMFNKEHGTEIAVVRGLNAYGPRQKEKPVRKIIPNFVIPALKNEEIIVYGDGSQIMDMIYVTDLAEILVRALVMEHKIYDKVFEAGVGRNLTVRGIAEETIKQVGGGRIKYVPMRPGETENSIVKANPETLVPLGFDSFVPFEEGLARTIPWYRKNL